MLSYKPSRLKAFTVNWSRHAWGPGHYSCLTGWNPRRFKAPMGFCSLFLSSCTRNSAAAAAAVVLGIVVGKSSWSARFQQGCWSDAYLSVQAGASSGRRRVVGAWSRATVGRRIQATRRAPGARYLRGTSGHPTVMTSAIWRRFFIGQSLVHTPCVKRSGSLSLRRWSSRRIPARNPHDSSELHRSRRCYGDAMRMRRSWPISGALLAQY